MTPQELKNSILQLAIQGKLVEQRPEEGTAAELYSRIQAEKQTLLRAGKIKREKPLPEITEEETPFDIPETWMWCYVGDLFQHNTGKALNSSDKSGTSMTYITTSNLYWDRLELDNLKEMPFTAAEVEKCTVQKGDLLVCEGGDYGRSAVWQYDYPMRIQNHIHRLRPYGVLSVRYFYYLFFLYKSAGLIAGKGIGIQGLSANVLHRLIIPLPPLAEQKRIVARIEELLPLVERYEAAWTRLEDLNKRFPGDMQKSLLQLAIQGKLVEQRPEEGSGEVLFRQIQSEKQALIKAGKVKRDRRTDTIGIPPDNAIPFDIPETWKWVYLGNILNKLTDGTHKTPKYSTSGVKFVSVKDMSSGRLSLENTKFITCAEHENLFTRCDPVRGDMLLSKVGTTGVPAIVDTDETFSLFVSVALLKYNHRYIDEMFLYLLLKSPLVQMQATENTRGVGNKNWVLDAIAKTMVTLPPLGEQKRIVARLKELLPLCKRL